MRPRRAITGAFLLALIVCAGSCRTWADPADPSRLRLADLSIDGLAARSYGATLGDLTPIPACGEPGSAFHLAYVADGLTLLARVDLPTKPAPKAGHPVLVFLHGWVGARAAPDYTLGCDPASIYHRLIARFRAAGFVVIVPGFRGHGRVRGRPADGLEDLRRFDNGSHLMPALYAIDTLNLLAALSHRDALVDPQTGAVVPLDHARIFVKGHSQGGDVALIVAATARGLAGVSIWAGTFPDRLTQLTSFAPMESAPEAFLAGDGAWTGTALAPDGRRNPDFVFGFPSDRIEDPDPRTWSWQRAVWSAPDVASVLDRQARDLYATLIAQTDAPPDIGFRMDRAASGAMVVVHDPRVVAALSRIGAFDRAEALTAPILLHYSDRDFYSWPVWNEDLCARITGAGGHCQAFVYPGNTHEFAVGRHAWFSPPGTAPGYDLMLDRDLAAFR